MFYYYYFYEGNEEESLHEGDIRLSYKQQIALEMFGDPTAPVLGARGITKYQKLLWNTRVVPYNISSELGEMNNETEKKKLLGVFAACFDTCACTKNPNSMLCIKETLLLLFTILPLGYYVKKAGAHNPG